MARINFNQLEKSAQDEGPVLSPAIYPVIDALVPLFNMSIPAYLGYRLATYALDKYITYKLYRRAMKGALEGVKQNKKEKKD